MRLTCPNCSARYEVDDGMIPPEGRDVQCSNCSTTWFQPGRRTPAEEVAEDDAAAAVAGPEDQQSPRREIDPSMRDVLREEAEREARLRRGGPEVVETQEEMPLDQGAGQVDRARAARERAERMRGTGRNGGGTPARVVMADAEAAQEAGHPRSDLLPDIEEINSTLRATSDRSAGEDAASDVDTVDLQPRRRRGFRLGFAFVLIVAALMVCGYAFAPEIVARLPQAGPILDGYVAQVDAARFWLDDLAQQAAEQLQQRAGGG